MVIRRNGLSWAKWEELGLKLGLLLPTLDVIRQDCRDAAACMMGCVAAWLQLKDKVHVMKTGRPSWHTLVQAIGKIDESIAQRMKQGTIEHMHLLIITHIWPVISVWSV